MIDVQSVGLLLMPSSREAAWRGAVGVAARQRGWTITKARGAQAEQTPCPKIILVTDARAVPLDAADVWVVIDGSLEEALAYGLARRSDVLEAQRFASVRLATASALIDAGAVVLDHMAEQLDIPGLGCISISESGSSPASHLDSEIVAPLAFYQRLPPAPGAQVTWPTSVFSYSVRREPTGGSPDIDLTGGGRVLMHGPYFELPAGWWRMTVRFSVDPDEAAHLLFEWGAGEDVTIYSGTFETAGFYELILDHQWREPAPAELRVSVERAHFMGQLFMQDCTVEFLPEMTDSFPGNG